MTGYQAETLIPVDIGEVLRDPALADLKDGPAKTFLLTLAHELDYDTGPPPQLYVRKSS